MTRIAGLVITGVVLMLSVTQGWGGPPNPTASDLNANTAGGTGALEDIGAQALFNTAFGAAALQSDTTGSANTASGALALQNNTIGGRNTASGVTALNHNTAGNDNTASGVDALFSNSTGNSNTASGVSALATNSTGNSNTASGVDALGSNATGFQNTAFGSSALSQSTGNKNIAVGFEAGFALTSGSKNIYLGHPGAASESNTMRLGNTQKKTYIAGVATAAVTGAQVLIDATGRLGVPLSSARYKRDIETMGARSEGVLKLRPVTFVYKQDGQGVRQYGLIAEEVATVYPELVTHTATGEVQAVRYQELIPMLVNELQRQQHVTEHLQRELAELRSLVGQMRGGIAQR
jgi:hypothetical protein